MEVLPSIDLLGGRVVRLIQGDYDRETVYGNDPLAVAESFAAAGARWVHVVDLDAARSGEPHNVEQAAAIAEAFDLRVEFGGGVRSERTVDALLERGLSRLVVGSAALADWEWFEKLATRADLAGRLALGLDARRGRLAVHGWTEQVSATALDVARRVRGWTLGAIVYTDIARDGTLSGPNVPATGQIVSACDVPVIASGGVSRLEDVAACRRIGCAGAIVGRAWYEGQIDLAAALRVARKDSASNT